MEILRLRKPDGSRVKVNDASSAAPAKHAADVKHGNRRKRPKTSVSHKSSFND